MKHILDAIMADDTSAEDFAALELPESYRAVTVHKDEVDMFEGMPTKEKDPRKSLHVDEVAAPRARPGRGLRRGDGLGDQLQHRVDLDLRAGLHLRLPRALRPDLPARKRHDLPYHVVGSDLAGVVLKTGAGVHNWKPGDRVVAHCLSVELEGPDGHNDTMLDPEQRIWGFETNFGGLAEVALVKSNQLMPKPEHLTWEEAASPGLVNSTAYRQLVSNNGGDMKQGDNVLIWGASGGLGGFATQYALNGGAIPICVVSNEEKAEIARNMGAELIINRSEEDYKFWNEDGTPRTPRSGSGSAPRSASSPAVRTSTSSSSTRAGRPSAPRSSSTRKGGVITTCASTSGYMHEYDNRYLWMNLKRIVELALRQLPRVVGGQPPDRQGHDPPHAVQDLPARGDRPGRPRRPPEPPPGQGRRARAWPPRRASASATRSCAPSTWTRSTSSAATELRQPTSCGAHQSWTRDGAPRFSWADQGDWQAAAHPGSPHMTTHDQRTRR